MSIKEFIDVTGARSILDMTEAQKMLAIRCLLTDVDYVDLVVQGFRDYLLADHHIATALLLNDELCGKAIKDSIYSCFESEIQDIIDGGL